jgi:hypothetical protein
VARLVALHDRRTTERFLRRDPVLHLFALADLDDRYWPHTSWYALEADGAVHQLALVYLNAPRPVLMALADERPEEARSFLRSLLSRRRASGSRCGHAVGGPPCRPTTAAPYRRVDRWLAVGAPQRGRGRAGSLLVARAPLPQAKLETTAAAHACPSGPHMTASRNGRSTAYRSCARAASSTA